MDSRFGNPPNPLETIQRVENFRSIQSGEISQAIHRAEIYLLNTSDWLKIEKRMIKIC